MPIYEYHCQACNHQLEALQKMSDAELRDCPQCGAAQLQKLISASAFRLKGGGWYETDFKGANQSNAAKSETDSAASANSCSASSSSDSSSTNSSCASCPAAAA